MKPAAPPADRHLLCIHDLDIPLSRRLATMREQLSAMLEIELDAVTGGTRFRLRGLELALLGAAEDAFALENAARVTAREKTTRPYWLRYFRR